MRTRSLLFLALSFGCGHGFSADVLYSVTDLGALLGTMNVVSGTGINDSGQVTGHWSGGAFLYSNGQMIDLGSLGGGETFAFDINNTEQVTGFSLTSARDVH